MINFWTDGGAKPVELCDDVEYIGCGRVFDELLLMRVTTVAGVRRQNKNKIKNCDAATTNLFDIVTSSFTPPYTLTIPLLPSITTTTCETQYPTRTEHLPKT